MQSDLPKPAALLVFPRVRIQNANAISSPLTWGFPAMSSFIGLMYALERKVKRHVGLQFYSVGVVCHEFQAQSSRNGYVHRFHLTRNPGGKDGGPSALVEEGRAHLELTIVLEVGRCPLLSESPARLTEIASFCWETLQGMRIAGGSVVPSRSGTLRHGRPELMVLASEAESYERMFRRLRRRWLPGFALVLRNDLLESHLGALKEDQPQATALDAWLDLSRLTYRPARPPATSDIADEPELPVEWVADRRDGWIVPIPVGFRALSQLYEAGEVSNARDDATPFRFVESLYSIGQWISPHRLIDVRQMLWQSQYDDQHHAYRCHNEFGRAKAGIAA